VKTSRQTLIQQKKRLRHPQQIVHSRYKWSGSPKQQSYARTQLHRTWHHAADLGHGTTQQASTAAPSGSTPTTSSGSTQHPSNSIRADGSLSRRRYGRREWNSNFNPSQNRAATHFSILELRPHLQGSSTLQQ